MAILAGKFESNKQDWETPQWLFDLLDAEFLFYIDLAASESNTKCRAFMTDALNHRWSGVC